MTAINQAKVPPSCGFGNHAIIHCYPYGTYCELCGRPAEDSMDETYSIRYEAQAASKLLGFLMGLTPCDEGCAGTTCHCQGCGETAVPLSEHGYCGPCEWDGTAWDQRFTNDNEEPATHDNQV